jgi:small subunit ribosomal protein S15
MARMYARKKGKSGSTKPLTPAKWVEFKPEEVDRLVVKLAKDKLSSPAIGRTLRDQYGIPSVRHATGKKLMKIMNENQLQPKIPEDLMNMFKKSVTLRKHLEVNKKDTTSKRGMELLESRIRRTIKYYSKTGKVPKKYKYDPTRVKLIIQTGEL